jgi:hypothetical protein
MGRPITIGLLALVVGATVSTTRAAEIYGGMVATAYPAMTAAPAPPPDETLPAEALAGSIRPITELSVSIAPEPGQMPADYAAQALGTQSLPAPEQFSDGPWTGYHWVAPSVCHRPLYFENASLERHGYSFGIAQPFASASHFVGNAAILPYRLVAEPPQECIYTLGHARPGSPTPPRYYRPPLSAKAGVAQAGAVTGLIFLIP